MFLYSIAFFCFLKFVVGIIPSGNTGHPTASESKALLQKVSEAPNSQLRSEVLSILECRKVSLSPPQVTVSPPSVQAVRPNQLTIANPLRPSQGPLRYEDENDQNFSDEDQFDVNDLGLASALAMCSSLHAQLTFCRLYLIFSTVASLGN